MENTWSIAIWTCHFELRNTKNRGLHKKGMIFNLCQKHFFFKLKRVCCLSVLLSISVCIESYAIYLLIYAPFILFGFDMFNTIWSCHCHDELKNLKKREDFTISIRISLCQKQIFKIETFLLLLSISFFIEGYSYLSDDLYIICFTLIQCTLQSISWLY